MRISKKYAQTALSSAESLLNLLNDILDYSKIEAGHLDVDALPVDLLMVIEDVVDLLVIRARDREVDLLVRYPQNVPRYLIGDPLRLRQVLVNLVGNAVKFTERGHVLISAAYDDGMMEISIEDTGVGIAENRLSAIFDKFDQGDVSTTRKFDGMGLGLAMSQSLVSLMGGGTIGVESVLGEGSTFSFKFRAVLDENRTEPPADNQLLDGRRVLIVDDEELNCQIFKETLESIGMPSVAVQSGPQALEALGKANAENQPFDAILLDFSMPIMNGEQTAMAIKVMPEMSDTILVMISASDETRDQARVERAGLSAWLTKPVRRAQLGSLFRGLLEAKGEKDQSDPDIAPKPAACHPSPPECLPNKGVDRSGPEILEGLEVLLVEDNRINQKIAQERLKGLRCQVTVAENGREAVEKVQCDAFDLILMDCQMPEMDGYEATQKIRELSTSGKVAPLPIIALTANAMAGDRQKCLSAGMDDYMSKPVRKETLVAALCTWAPVKKTSAANEPLPDAVTAPPQGLPDLPAAASATTSGTVHAAPPESTADTSLATSAHQVMMPVASAPSEMDDRAPAASLSSLPPQQPPSAAAAPATPEATPPPSCPSKTDASAVGASPSPSDNTGGGIDEEILDGIRESMGDQFGVILQYYLEDADDYVAKIGQARAAGDIEAMVAPAHTLKSSSRQIGALQVSKLAEQIE
ncbi:MAG: response regulator, partial [Alphaproteobacteria bacterium]|nr:response regulator [Alphaproteobacteria bacterium]